MLKKEEIVSIEEIDNQEGEYVYDAEVEDTHTFFGNDILLHNSIYVEFGRIVNQLNIPRERHASFVVDLWNYGCGPYMAKCYEEYAKYYNCDKNVQELELEKIADTAVMVAKKHYAMSECFKEPNIYLEPGEEILYKGLEIVQGSTPPFARKCQKEFTEFILSWYAEHTERPDFGILFNMVKKFKAEFIMQEPDNICKGQAVGDYDKFIADDKNHFAFKEHCPIHVKGAGIANFILNQPKNKKFRVKYNKIKTRDKVKFYYTTDPNYPVFAFLPNNFPLEYAPPIDYNLQFEKLVLEPINRIMAILKHSLLTPDLCYTTALF